jgi:hypothetical protein
MGHRHNRNMREFRYVFFLLRVFSAWDPRECGVETFETEGAMVAMVDWNHKTIDDGVHSFWPQIRRIRQLWVLKPADPLVVVDLGRGKLNCL